MKRDEILDAVKKTITQDRNNRHGEPENSFPRIAEEWTRYLDRIGLFDLSHELKPSDVAEMMAIFKTVRFEMQPDNPDNEHDRIGYYAIAAELRAAEREQVAATYASNDFNIVLEDDATPVSDEFANRWKDEPTVKHARIGGYYVDRVLPHMMDLSAPENKPKAGEIAARSDVDGSVTIYRWYSGSVSEFPSWRHVKTLYDFDAVATYRQALDQ